MTTAIVVLVLVGLGVEVAEYWVSPVASVANVELSNRIPVPQPAVVYPRELAGFGAVFLAIVFLALYFYRRKTFILQWARGWSYLAIAMFLQTGMNPVSPSSAAVAVSFLFVIASAFTLIKGAASLRGDLLDRRRHGFLIAVCLLWYVLARLVISRPAAFAGALMVIAVLLAYASYDYLRLARDRRRLGAAAIGAALAIIVASNLVIAVMVPWLVVADGVARNVLLVTVACYAVVALGMFALVFEEVTAELQRLAVTDPLTGCYNRHHLNSIVRAELKRHDRFGIPLSVMFIDVNHFKQVNDAAGHAAGDKVLIHVAQTLRAHIREFDLLCRWGGDEFVILMGCDEAAAITKGRDLQRVFELSLAAGDWPLTLGLSIGVAGVPAGATDIVPFIRQADERMYADKLGKVR